MADENRAIDTDGDAGQAARVRVLVVDDSESSRSRVAQVLEGLSSVEIVQAASGAQALRELGEHEISIVVCDYEMPGMSGLQVLRFVRKLHSAVELPVLMITGHDEPEVKVQAFRAGANDYIGKQAEPEELLARVGTQIELLQAHRRLNDARLRHAEHQKFEAIGHLAEGLAHELNTPAQYIQDNLAFLAESFEALCRLVAELRELLPAPAERSLVEAVLDRIEYDYLLNEVPRCIGESRQGIEQVARVVAVMREFARPGIPERKKLSLNELIRGAIAVTHGQWHQVAELEVELSDTLPHVQCVGVAIKQVVLYAILNAVKAMARGSADRPKGKLRIATRVEAPNWALIEIEDNGLGMADTTVQRIMDPVLSSRSTKDTDQALAHARAVIVQEHQGRIDLRSSPEGTTLAIHLPIEVPITDSESEVDEVGTWG
jgi:CheY-like chemotaxis protein